MAEFRRLRSALLALLILGLGVGPALAETRLAGLRGGKVWIAVDAPGAELSVSLRPAYGWSEPVRLYAPDGRLEKELEISRERSTETKLALDAKGVHMLHLKRSYVAEVRVEGARVEVEPLMHETSVQAPGGAKVYFRVPEGTASFSVRVDNRIGLRGEDVLAVVRAPDGGTETVRKAGFSRRQLLDRLGALGLDQSGQPLSAATPDASIAELSPAGHTYTQPAAGIWSFALNGADAGVWLEGIPNRFAVTPEELFPSVEAEPVAAKVTLTDEAIVAPVLGAVGHLGPPGNPYEAKILSYGVRGDQIYLHQGPGGFDHMERLVPRPGVHSLVILRSLDAATMKLGAHDGFVRAGEWVAGVLAAAKRPWESFTLQVMNEPNLEYRKDDYLTALGGFIEGLKAANVPMDKLDLAAPALGSGESPEIVDWPWIEGVIDRYDRDVDTIVWNLYRVRDVEDTDLYAAAVAKTVKIIHDHDTDGHFQSVVIGATNRVGGFSDDALFDGAEAGVWWASVIANVANTGEVNLLDYFSTLDSGQLRAKGLFARDWRVKPQAIAQRAMGNVLGVGGVRRVTTDHPMLEGVASVTGGRIRLALVNKGWLPLKVTLPDNPGIALRQVIGPDAEATDQVLKGNEVVLAPMSVYAGGY